MYILAILFIILMLTGANSFTSPYSLWCQQKEAKLWLFQQIDSIIYQFASSIAHASGNNNSQQEVVTIKMKHLTHYEEEQEVGSQNLSR